MDKQMRGAFQKNQYLRFLVDMMSIYSKDQIKIPGNFHEMVTGVKKITSPDNTGLINTITNFGINAATTDIHVKTSIPNFTRILNTWLKTVNFKMKMAGTGIKELSNQYYKERWQNSSFIVLKTEWQNIDGIMLPIKMYFLDGGCIYTHNASKIIDINNLEYKLVYGSGKDDYEILSDTNTIKYFFQNPYGMWGEKYPIPYLIKNGAYYNAEFLQIIKNKGASLAQRALEHLFLMKKGFEKAATEDLSEFIYSPEELKATDDAIKKKISEKNYDNESMLSMTSNFDTEVENIIPDYKKLLHRDITAPAEMALLASLGFVEIYNTSNRKESVLNPKPFMAEVEDGVQDFVSMLNDIILTIVEVNKINHRKYVNADIKVNYSAIKEFIDHNAKQLIRSAYDRGTISRETYNQLGVGVDHDIQVVQIKEEQKEGVDELMVPNPVQYTDLLAEQNDNYVPNDNITPEKQGPESKNYIASISTEELLETAPYTDNKDLPKEIRKLPIGAQTIWRETINSLLDEGEEETTAIKIAWKNVKAKYEKDEDTQKWKKIK